MPKHRKVTPALEAAIKLRLAYIGSNIAYFDEPQKLRETLDALIARAGLDAVVDETALDLSEFLYLDPALRNLLLTPVADLEFSARVFNALGWHGIRTLEDLVEWSDAELGRIRNLGRTAMDEIRSKLHDLGLHLSRHDVRDLTPPPGDQWATIGRAGLNPLQRRVLRSRVPRLPIHWIMQEYNPDDFVLGQVRYELNVEFVWQLVACRRSQLRQVDWTQLPWSPPVMDPADYAIARIEAMLLPYDLALPAVD